MLAGLSAVLAGMVLPTASAQEWRPPNVVIVFTDDQGYGDLSCQGHPTLHTPHLDALATRGVKLTQFYVAAPLCSPSRAALLTGCYPKRVGMHRHVVFPGDDRGLAPSEVTLAEVLRARGYATACFGKWHLGHRRGLLPTDQGFDEFFGVPYSNDMAQQHRRPDNDYPFRLPLLHGTEVVEWEPDQRLLTRRYTDAAIAFIEAHHDRPFFVYLPHSMPHIPIYASDEFAGRSPRGLYGDVIEEIDANVGRLVATLDRLGVRDDTLLIFTSDNGPWLQFGENGGSAGPLRGGKGTNWEGGQREPAIASWPGTLPEGAVCREVVTSMDLLPTIAAWAGAALDPERTIDGHDVRALLRCEPGAQSPTDAFLYYASRGELAGIRRGAWKLLLEPGELYHLEHDIGEQRDVAARHPELCAELRALALERDAAITAAARPEAHVEELVFDPRK
ncbi:MAG: sulfatase [Planctomycetes bacterium]|nr:sulfatase [Planctomycetota bacterium]